MSKKKPQISRGEAYKRVGTDMDALMGRWALDGIPIADSTVAAMTALTGYLFHCAPNKATVLEALATIFTDAHRLNSDYLCDNCRAKEAEDNNKGELDE